MTVKKLIELLSTCNGDDLIVLAKDREGNDFSPLEHISEDSYLAESTWSGHSYLRTLTPEAEADGYTEEDVRTGEDGAVPCITCWPIN